jgi:3D (Asp-Asp-Asp) domain-containing protein
MAISEGDMKMKSKVIVESATYLGAAKNSVYNTQVSVSDSGDVYIVHGSGSAIKGDKGSIVYKSDSTSGLHYFEKNVQ